MTNSKVTLYTNKDRLEEAAISALEKEQIAIEPYDAVVEHLQANPLCSSSEVRLTAQVSNLH